MAESEAPSKAIEARHERRDFHPKNVVVFALSLAVTVIVVGWVCYELFGFFSRIEMKTQAPPSPLAISPRPVPGPHLLVRPGEDLKRLRAAEDALLNSYGWIDRDKGLVHIPIGRAIDILAQKGLPTRAQTGSSQLTAKSTQ